AFDCPTGPSDIIENDEDGFLLEKENINAKADALLFFIQNEEKRKQFGKNGQKNIQRFLAGKIYEQWRLVINVE
ncbi:MAG: glycosyltransferase, partial [Chitinophagaceae bacterium]